MCFLIAHRRPVLARGGTTIPSTARETSTCPRWALRRACRTSAYRTRGGRGTRLRMRTAKSNQLKCTPFSQSKTGQQQYGVWLRVCRAKLVTIFTTEICTELLWVSGGGGGVRGGLRQMECAPWRAARGSHSYDARSPRIAACEARRNRVRFSIKDPQY